MNEGKPRRDLKSAQFSVDAALLRELGQRLIGRAHIALAELVKNSFDADAHTCRIDIESDRIVVSDDGHGISEEEFLKYWMRIGTTHKVESRQSRSLGRSMTGSKGLGRLSVQFLADEMSLESNCDAAPETMLYAEVDWRKVHSGEDLQTVNVDWVCDAQSSTYADDSATGTRITLAGLRTEWDGRAIEELGKDVWMLRSPFRFGGATQGKTALDFSVDLIAPEIESARTRFDKLHDALFGNWMARITGVLVDGRLSGRRPEAIVSVEFVPGYPDGVPNAGTFRETTAFPIPRKPDRSGAGRTTGESSRDGATTRQQRTLATGINEGGLKGAALDQARFTILVFKPEGRQAGGVPVGEMRDYLRTYGGVSVYDAGFRLPYYGSQALGGHDWLNIGVDQGRRLIASELLPERWRVAGRYLLDLPNPGRIFGAVEVDTNHERRLVDGSGDLGDCLQIQPGRDRLAPNRSFFQLRDLVRFSVDFYANRYRAVADDAAQTRHRKEPPAKALRSARETLERYRSELPEPVYRDIRREVDAVSASVETESKALDSRATLLAPLATAGMAALAMDHELSNNAVLLDELADFLHRVLESDASPEAERAVKVLGDYRARFDAFRGLLSPLADGEERRATRRVAVEFVVDLVVRALRRRFTGVAFAQGGIPQGLRFPVGAVAEWSAIIQNILFNAWNAMLESDQRMVRFDGSLPDARRQYLRVSDTGVGLAMEVDESEVLFEAFERSPRFSEANQSVAIGGQGLGLAIVRMIANSRGADVAFVEPKPGFTTTIEISWRS